MSRDEEPGGGWGQPRDWGAPSGWEPAEAWQAPPAPRPGTIPLRPLGVGDILEGTIRTLRRAPGATFGASVVVFGIAAAVQVLVLLPGLRAVTSLPDPGLLDGSLAARSPEEVEAALRTFGEAVAALPWRTIVIGVSVASGVALAAYAVLVGVVVLATSEAAIGRPVGLRSAVARAAPRSPRLGVTVVLVALAVAAPWIVVALAALLAAALADVVLAALAAAGSLLALGVSAVVGVRLSLSTTAVMLERRELVRSDTPRPISPWYAMRRSASLVRGAWWRTLGILLLASLVAGALAQLLALPVSLLLGAGVANLSVTIWATLIASVLSQVVVMPVTTVVLALVYLDRRMRTEGLAEAMIQAAEVPPGQA